MLDRWLDDYEAAWRSCTSPPSLLEFVHQVPNENLSVVAELALIDLEQRWRLCFPTCESPAERIGELSALPTWADYCQLLPDCELNWIDGICHEFRVRQAFGDRPHYRQVMAPYAAMAEELAHQLPQLAAEMTRAMLALIHDGVQIYNCRSPGRFEIGRRRFDEPAAPVLTGIPARLLIADLPVTHISRSHCLLEFVAKGRIHIQHLSRRGSIRCGGEILSKDDSCEMPLPCRLDFGSHQLHIE